MQFLVAALVVLNILAAWKLCTSWFSPAAVNALMWSIFAVSALLLYGRNENMRFFGVAFLLLLALTMVCGDWLSQRISITARPRFVKKDYCVLIGNSIQRMAVWTIVYLLLGLLREILNVYFNGYSLRDFLNLKAFLKMNAEMAQNRYNGDSGFYSIYLQILGCFTYAAPFCGGWLFPLSEKWYRKVLCFATFIPVLIATLLTNGKIGLIATTTLWLIACLLSFINANGNVPKIERKLIIRIGGAGLLLFVVLLFTMMARIGSLGLSVLGVVLKKFMTYAFGHMEAFDIWFYRMLEGQESFSLGFGANTFMSVYNALFDGERLQGVYTTIEGATSNVFTAYRGVVMDFGIVGAIATMLFLGILSGMLFQRILEQKAGSIAVAGLAAIYFFVIYAMIVSPWVYTSYVCTFVLIWAFLAFPAIFRKVSKWITNR